MSGQPVDSWDVVRRADQDAIESALEQAAALTAPLWERKAYADILPALLGLESAIHAFFDKVMVLDNDETIRGANLGLIDEVLSGFSGIADFSEIVTA